jgi:hypothetical protein
MLRIRPTEVPSNPFHAPKWRPLPYIYTPEEIVQLLGATSRLRQSYPLRRQVYATMMFWMAYGSASSASGSSCMRRLQYGVASLN